MASIQRHCARARSYLPSKPSPAVAPGTALRSRSVHTTTRLQADEKNTGGSDGAKRSPPAQLRSVTRNRAAFNALKGDGPQGGSNGGNSSNAKQAVSRFVNQGSRPARSADASSSGVTDARNLGSNTGSGPSGAPMLARRRPPGATGAGPRRTGGAPRNPSSPNFGGGSGGNRGGMRSGGAAAAGGAPKSPRRRARAAYGDLSAEDEAAMAEGAFTDATEAAAEREQWEEHDEFLADDVEDGLDEIEWDKSLGPDYEGYIESMRSNPAEAMEMIKGSGLTDKEKEYIFSQTAVQTGPDVYQPSFNINELKGMSAGLAVGSPESPVGAADALHQALGRATPISGVPSHMRDTRAVARELVSSKADAGVMLPANGTASAESALSEVESHAASWATQMRSDKAQREGKPIADIAVRPHELKTVSEADRTAVNEFFIAGKYAAPGSLAPRNAGDVMREVYRAIARNGSYGQSDSQKLATKISSMIPVTRTAPAQAKGGAAPGSAASAAAGAGKQAAKKKDKQKAKAV